MSWPIYLLVLNFSSGKLDVPQEQSSDVSINKIRKPKDFFSFFLSFKRF